MAINGIGAPRRKTCVPRLCVQCREMWAPEPHEHQCKRCGPCRTEMTKSQAAKCTNCGTWMSLRPSAYWERKHSGDWVCARCKAVIYGNSRMRKAQESIHVPCGSIFPAAGMTRCAGFNPVGDSDGCQHYENCMSIAAKQQWDGFTATSGRRKTAEWKYVDELWDFIKPQKHQQKAGRYA